jgi:L-threonylcarbamoyladenylate synthase
MSLPSQESTCAERLTWPLSVAGMRRVQRALSDGEVITFPTETSYALGGNALLPSVTQAIYRLKGRDPGKSLLLLIEGAQVERWVSEVPEGARMLMARFWPGPLTLVLRAARDLPGHLPDVRGTIAVRWSPHPVVAELLRLGGVPLIGTSANVSGTPPLFTCRQVLGAFPGASLLGVDGGPAPGGGDFGTPASTVLDCTLRPFVLVREGAVSRATLREALASHYSSACPT